MTTKELRIGNIVNVVTQHKPFETIVESLDAENVGFQIGLMGVCNMPVKHISGIPITVGLLISIGFMAGVDLDSEPFFGSKRLHISKYDFGYKDSEWFVIEMIGMQTEIKIEFLHQLQNLFFAVTGEEIEIDLDKISTK